MWETMGATGRAALAKAEAFHVKALGTVSPTIAVYHAREKEAPVYTEKPGPFGENLTGPMMLSRKVSVAPRSASPSTWIVMDLLTRITVTRFTPN